MLICLLEGMLLYWGRIWHPLTTPGWFHFFLLSCVCVHSHVWLFVTPWTIAHLKEMGIPASWEICMHVKKQQLELDMEQQTSSKSGKEYVKAVYCHPAYLTYMQNTSCEMLGWMKHKLESRFLGEISITSNMQMIPPLWQKAKRNQRASWKWKRRVRKVSLKLSIQKTKIMAFGPIS